MTGELQASLARELEAAVDSGDDNRREVVPYPEREGPGPGKDDHAAGGKAKGRTGMKDGVHLLSGMVGAMLTLAACIFMWGVAMRCFGGERLSITSPSGDGANYITTEVDENGYVMGEKSTAVYVAPKYIPQSGERCVIADMKYVLIAARDWERITNAIARLDAVAERRWANEHKTDAATMRNRLAVLQMSFAEATNVDSRLEAAFNATSALREAFHGGKPVTRYVTNAEERVCFRVDVYPDGYEHIEQRLAEARAQAEELREKWQTALERATTAEAKAVRGAHRKTKRRD